MQCSLLLVMALGALARTDAQALPDASLVVSLEPCSTCVTAGYKYCKGDASAGEENVCFFAETDQNCSDFSSLADHEEFFGFGACDVPFPEEVIDADSCATCLANGGCKWCDGDEFFDEVDTCFCGAQVINCTDFGGLFFSTERRDGCSASPVAPNAPSSPTIPSSATRAWSSVALFCALIASFT